MPRLARRVFPGMPHHVTQRGNRGGDVFFSDFQRSAYLNWLREYCNQHNVDILAYCLMTNHIHAVVVPANADGLERVFRPLHSRYAQHVNRVNGWKGHLWQGRYFSAVMDEPYMWAAVRYVERNPVRAGMVARSEAYRWSSAAAHCGLRDDILLSRERAWLGDLDLGDPWSGWLAEGDDPERVRVLRQNVVKGLPCGDEDFVRRLLEHGGLARTIASSSKP